MTTALDTLTIWLRSLDRATFELEWAKLPQATREELRVRYIRAAA